MKVVIEGLEEGQVVVVTVIGVEYLDDDPDPGEEIPEEEEATVRTVIGKVVNL